MCKNQKFCVYNFIMLDSVVLIFEIVKKKLDWWNKNLEDLRIMLPLNKKSIPKTTVKQTGLTWVISNSNKCILLELLSPWSL